MIEFSILQSIPAIVVGVTLFLLLIASYILGYRLHRAKRLSEDHENKDLTAINGALLGLLALLLAFTFSYLVNGLRQLQAEWLQHPIPARARAGPRPQSRLRPAVEPWLAVRPG